MDIIIANIFDNVLVSHLLGQWGFLHDCRAEGKCQAQQRLQPSCRTGKLVCLLAYWIHSITRQQKRFPARNLKMMKQNQIMKWNYYKLFISIISGKSSSAQWYCSVCSPCSVLFLRPRVWRVRSSHGTFGRWRSRDAPLFACTRGRRLK